MKIGLKLYTTDFALILDALVLRTKGIFDFVELYVIPGSFNNTIERWKGFSVPFIIHAPHSYHGINFAQADKWEMNNKNFSEAKQFADILCSQIIIVHGGNNGIFKETLRQIKLLNEKRIVLENKPKISLDGEECVGWSPEEFLLAINSGIIRGTALDFGHATCASRSLGLDSMKIINQFMMFQPKIFHLADGDLLSEKDRHYNLGKGNYNIPMLLSLVPKGGALTIETPRDPLKGLEDFINDVQFVRHCNQEREKNENIIFNK